MADDYPSYPLESTLEVAVKNVRSEIVEWLIDVRRVKPTKITFSLAIDSENSKVDHFSPNFWWGKDRVEMIQFLFSRLKEDQQLHLTLQDLTDLQQEVFQNTKMSIEKRNSIMEVLNEKIKGMKNETVQEKEEKRLSHL